MPRAFIGWAVEDKAADLLDELPWLDTHHVLERHAWRKNYLRTGPFLSFIREIRKTRYDIAFDFHGNAKSGVVTWLSRAPIRIGFARKYSKECNFLATNRHIVPPGHNINRYERNFSLVEPVIGPPPYDLDIEIPIGEKVRDDIDRYLNKWRDPNRPFVLVHPITSRPFKVWPAANYATVCDKLTAGPEQCQIMLTWGPGEQTAAQQIADLASTRIDLAPPMPSLKHFAYLVSRADVYFGGDTGPMHIASTMGTPVVAIFGPTDPAVNGPYREPNRVLYSAMDCSPCRERRCDKNHECMTAITPQMARTAILDLIKTATRDNT